MGFFQYLRVKHTASMPSSKDNIGCVLDNRYFYYNVLAERAYWICWDMQKKREVLVKKVKNDTQTPKRKLHKSNNEDNQNELKYGGLFMDRYYVMNKTAKDEYIVCWDMLKKREVAINTTQVICTLSKTSWLLEENENDSTGEGSSCSTYNSSVDMDNNIRATCYVQPEYRRGKVPIEHPVECGYVLLDRYRVVEWLSDHANAQYSNVCLCYDDQEQCYVAIKIFKLQHGFVTYAAGEIDMLNEIHERFPMDVRTSRIIKMLGSFRVTNEEGFPLVCIIFEAMHGDLHKLMNGCQGLPVEVVKSIIRQMLEGLEFLHERFHIIHSDLKLENVLYFQNNQHSNELTIKIADFGNSSWMEEQLSPTIQTEPYRSVEVIINAGYDVSADIWSTACIAYELATGRPLFHITTDSMHEVLHLADMIALLGPIPQEILARGMKSKKFFNSEGQLHIITAIQYISLLELLQRNSWWSATDMEDFAAFLTPMLEYDMTKRATAVACLQHAWLTEQNGTEFNKNDKDQL